MNVPHDISFVPISYVLIHDILFLPTIFQFVYSLVDF